MDIIRAIDNVIVENRKVIELDSVLIIVDWTPEGYLTKLADENNNVLSNIIRGFKTRDLLNNFLMERFGIKVNIDFVPFVEGIPIPGFKDMYIKEWERVN